MKLPRRRFLHLAASTALVSAVPRVECSQGYPSRPVHLIVGFAAGNGPDIVARLTGEWLSQRIGQQVVVENRVGAASDLAVQAVVKAAPDGYTLLQITPANAINTNLSGGINFIRDIVPVASVARGSFVVVVDPSFPAKTLPELIRYARAKPDKVNLGSPGTGSAPYFVRRAVQDDDRRRHVARALSQHVARGEGLNVSWSPVAQTAIAVEADAGQGPVRLHPHPRPGASRVRRQLEARRLRGDEASTRLSLPQTSVVQ